MPIMQNATYGPNPFGWLPRFSAKSCAVSYSYFPLGRSLGDSTPYFASGLLHSAAWGFVWCHWRNALLDHSWALSGIRSDTIYTHIEIWPWMKQCCPVMPLFPPTWCNSSKHVLSGFFRNFYKALEALEHSISFYMKVVPHEISKLHAKLANMYQYKGFTLIRLR
jgi:hypothetical protein